MKRFWAKVRKTDGCWLWTSAITAAGYGEMWLDGEPQYAHRISWTIHNGPIPLGMMVLHHCDVRRCIRPDHLFLGDAAANSADMVKKGRTNPVRGEAIKAGKLTEIQVLLIRQRYADGLRTHRSLAQDFNVSASTITRIINREYWAHI